MKSKIFTTSSSYEGKRSSLNHSLMALSAFTGTLLVTSSVVQATDLQIYAAPTAGKKTIVMMLDTSGSMAEYDNDSCLYQSRGNWYYYGLGTEAKTTAVPYDRLYCKNSSGKLVAYDRLTRLKDGMFAFLNSDNETLRSVRVGLGNFSAGGDARSGQILVPAVALGVVDSDQRKALKNAMKNLTANAGTPTAHAYAEAAAYLMGTKTFQIVKLSKAPVLFVRNSSNTHKKCNTWNATGTSCTSWSNLINNKLVDDDKTGLTTTTCNVDNQSGTCYSKTGDHINVDSGFSKSSDTTKTADKTTYNTPLPAVADRQSCDGQGVYVLSDGAANSTDEGRASSLMSNALGSTYGNGFNCDGGLAEGNDDSGNAGGWRCMGEYAKKLFDKTKNPTGVSIQTAFVGFGNDMNDLSNKYVENACRLSSRTQDDRTSDDSCSPTVTTNYKTPKPGYGNGGFFIASQSTEITNSVIQFIDNLGKTPINPLSTGAVSVPVDALSPQTFQPYGYLRALEPKPGTQNITWAGNLKKYGITGGALKNGTNYTFNTDGTLNSSSQDKWNGTTLTDGEGITVGGVYSKLKLPTTVTPTGFRPLFSDIKSIATDGTITTSDQNTDLLSISQSATTPGKLLENFSASGKLANLTLDMKLKLLNYFGYDLPLDTKPLPTTLTAPKDPFTSMGASIHSFPVQMTYKGTLDADGNLTSEGTAGARDQSLLYGSSEGALRIVNSSTGEEQMVFVPAKILTSTASKALRKGSSDTKGMTHGISGAWIADSDYKVVSATDTTTSVVAKKMNVYGGMRMGGNSYYGLDVLTPTEPKLLFNIVGGAGDFARMGQTWSKPVMANIRYENIIRRVMIVGGGYDMCYENPRFKLNGSNSNTDYTDLTCNNKSSADGNAIYIIDAKTGERIWWASNTDANTNNVNMTHSIVSRIGTLDRDSDGLVDQLYFGDLGGQVFRIDLNNTKNTTATNFGKRIVRLANLGTKADGTAITTGDQPRFYQPPTLTVHDEASSTFVMVGIASGDRSTPLDVSPTQGRELMKPFDVLTGRPNNNVYGLIDRDVADASLYTGAKDAQGVLKDYVLKTVDLTLKSLVANPQKITTKVSATFFPYDKDGKQGWYRSLSSDQNGTMIPNRETGGVKAFEEEPVAMTGRLIVPVYDPQGTGLTDRQNPCQPRVVGESNTQQFCLPFGACLNATTGLVDTIADALTGFQIKDGKNQNLLGPGIQGITFGPDDTKSSTTSNCGAITLLGLQQGKGRWECNKILNPIRWYEKYVEAKKS